MNQNIVRAINNLSHALRNDQISLRPTSFDGSGQQSFDLFLEKYTKFCDYTNKNQDERLKLFPLCLKDNAFEFYCNLPEEIKNEFDQLIN